MTTTPTGGGPGVADLTLTNQFSNGYDAAYEFSGNASIDALLGGSSWGTGPSNSVVLTYSFPDASSLWASNYGGGSNEASAGLTPLNSAQQQAFREALATWSEVADIKFQEVSDTSASVGDIRVAFSQAVSGQAAGWAYLPSPGSYNYSGSTLNSYTIAPSSGDVWLDPADAGETNWAEGSANFATLVHELGHALGLKHPFEAEESGQVLSGSEDTSQYSIMSYTDYPAMGNVYTSTGGNSYSYTAIQANGPMMYDILAMQYLYGANMSTRTGDDTYIFSSSTPFLETIWDAGGTDTIDASTQLYGVQIDLRDGHFSSVGVKQTGISTTAPAEGNLGIAHNAYIENAVGSDHNDLLQGNALDNVLTGKGGDDTLKGDAGTDTALYFGLSNQYQIAAIDQANNIWQISGMEGTDRLEGIEKLKFNDKLISVEEFAGLVAPTDAETDTSTDDTSDTTTDDTTDQTTDDVTDDTNSGGSEHFTAYNPSTGNTDTLVDALLDETSQDNIQILNVKVTDSTQANQGGGIYWDKPVKDGYDDYDDYYGGYNQTQYSVSLYDGGIQGIDIGSGIFLSTGTATPPSTNTQGGYSVQLGLPGSDRMDAVASQAFSGAGKSKDLTQFEMTFNVVNPNIKSISLDLVFASDEYPEFSNSSYVDIAAAFVNGYNYAYFNGDISQPLSVIDANLANNFESNENGQIAIEYDGISNKLSLVAPVDLGKNTLTLAIADTGDMSYDSGLFISNLQTLDIELNPVSTGTDDFFGEGTSGTEEDGFFFDDSAAGIQKPVTGTPGKDTLQGTEQSELFNALPGDDKIITGGGNDVVMAGAGNDQVEVTGSGNVSLYGASGYDVATFAELSSDQVSLKKVGTVATLEVTSGDHQGTVHTLFNFEEIKLQDMDYLVKDLVNDSAAVSKSESQLGSAGADEVTIDDTKENVSASGGLGDDVYHISANQKGEVYIADIFGTNTIDFTEASIEMAFNYQGQLAVKTTSGAKVFVEFADQQLYNYDGQQGLSLTGFIQNVIDNQMA
ncbi:Matrixin [Allopseudospirillum japonicum]|uniref:Matrixin n=1 Tax=Allopseudospirillum japonicum TaxID=64971 RepID=A0A1H6SC03_9GAMM|nr:choice-of-anchor L domain-containing protein [Allopseudospirillum japonicum]SEI64336.1 Matrixin [Allopseudospirillum japonicum]